MSWIPFITHTSLCTDEIDIYKKSGTQGIRIPKQSSVFLFSLGFLRILTWYQEQVTRLSVLHDFFFLLLRRASLWVLYSQYCLSQFLETLLFSSANRISSTSVLFLGSILVSVVLHFFSLVQLGCFSSYFFWFGNHFLAPSIQHSGELLPFGTSVVILACDYFPPLHHHVI